MKKRNLEEPICPYCGNVDFFAGFATADRKAYCETYDIHEDPITIEYTCKKCSRIYRIERIEQVLFKTYKIEE